jgi:hypothetical protein
LIHYSFFVLVGLGFFFSPEDREQLKVLLVDGSVARSEFWIDNEAEYERLKNSV